MATTLELKNQLFEWRDSPQLEEVAVKDPVKAKGMSLKAWQTGLSHIQTMRAGTPPSLARRAVTELGLIGLIFLGLAEWLIEGKPEGKETASSCTNALWPNLSTRPLGKYKIA